ncbi:hypothetical protein NT6N_17970 [Oceaniferula spumae]|uniref:Glycosyltransferase n=1 Tax=Oceaniferula spumae TaxID=2979115 RepID=A0AAT9FKX7_9BACT
MKPLKIAILGRYRNKSANGVDRTIAGHIFGLAEEGHKVTLLTVESPGKAETEELARSGISLCVITASSIFFVFSILRLRGKFDLLWLHSVFTLRNWIAFSLLGCPWITTPNGGYSPGQIRYKSRLFKKLALLVVERRMIRNALFVHTLTETESSDVKHLNAKARTVIAMNGCETEPYEPVRFNDNDCTIRFLFIGRISVVHKGLDLLITALESVPKTTPWRLDIVGKGSDTDTEALSLQIKQKNLESKVTLKGLLFGNDKQEILSSCHVFVHTSRWEGMPFSIIESMCASRPVLITTGTNMGKFVTQHDTGWVADISAESIANSLNEILRSGQDVIVQKSKNAHSASKLYLTWDSVMAPIFDELRTIHD